MNAPSGNRTRGRPMATVYFTTKPMALSDGWMVTKSNHSAFRYSAVCSSIWLKSQQTRLLHCSTLSDYILCRLVPQLLAGGLCRSFGLPSRGALLFPATFAGVSCFPGWLLAASPRAGWAYAQREPTLDLGPAVGSVAMRWLGQPLPQ
jgi:hypothetical protein